MNKLVILSVLVLGCVHAAPVATPTLAQPSRAIAIMVSADKDAKCMDLRRPFDVEDSAICATGGALVWLSVSATHVEIKQLTTPPRPAASPVPAPTVGPTVPAPTTAAPVPPMAHTTIPTEEK